MYCSHCGYDLKDKKIDQINKNHTFLNGDTKNVYVCPRCSHIIKEDFNEEDVKALARASHAEIHRSRNLINSGLCFLMIFIILFIVSIMFFAMSFKASAGGQLVTTSTEFYVFIVLLALSILTIIYSSVNLVRGIKKNRKYSLLLKEIQNGTFIQ